MCWLCDHPTATTHDYLEVLREKVRRDGWAVQYIEDARMPFAYTVGLSDWGLPDVMITSVSKPRAWRLVNAVARRAMDGDAMDPGTRITLPGGPQVEFVVVDRPDVHMCWALNYARFPVRAVQAVWADGHGRWPWSPDFCDGRRIQPVLGLRAWSRRD
jgi:hypothetical protein